MHTISTKDQRGEIMAIGYVFYNKKAGKAGDCEEIKRLSEIFEDELKFVNVEEIEDHKALIRGMQKGDFIVISGGDGTLNNFINKTEGVDYPGEIYCFPTGSGNDFAREMGYAKGSNPFPVSEYFRKLPCAIVNGKRYRFINGVGFGIDGYCCEKGDELKLKGKTDVNYAAIAIKGLLGAYRPTDARITVDGVTKAYKNVWLAPTMFGKYYGGGMMPAPAQERRNDAISVMVYHSKSKLKSLLAFPGMFTGKHVKHSEIVEVRSGREIHVEFDRPSPLQVDGETLRGVTSYTALCPSLAEKAETSEEAKVG